MRFPIVQALVTAYATPAAATAFTKPASLVSKTKSEIVCVECVSGWKFTAREIHEANKWNFQVGRPTEPMEPNP